MRSSMLRFILKFKNGPCGKCFVGPTWAGPRRANVFLLHRITAGPTSVFAQGQKMPGNFSRRAIFRDFPSRGKIFG